MSDDRYLKLYEVFPNVPVKFRSYFVLAHNFSEAAAKTLSAENRDGADCFGIYKVKHIGGTTRLLA